MHLVFCVVWSLQLYGIIAFFDLHCEAEFREILSTN